MPLLVEPLLLELEGGRYVGPLLPATFVELVSGRRVGGDGNNGDDSGSGGDSGGGGSKGGNGGKRGDDGSRCKGRGGFIVNGEKDRGAVCGRYDIKT